MIKALNNRPNKNKAGKNTQDKDARYNVKISSDGKMKTTYGFKGHIASDEDGFVTQTVVTTGKLHDSQVFEELLTGNEVEVYADSATTWYSFLPCLCANWIYITPVFTFIKLHSGVEFGNYHTSD